MIIYNDFERFSKIEYCACDTETLTYIDGIKVSEAELQEMGKTQPQSWFREHASVRVWAWIISDGIHLFVTNDFDEFIAFFGEHKCKCGWFYNAKFDFAQIDYQLLTHNPVYTINDKRNSAWTYSSLHSDKGGRFSLKIWTPYKAVGEGSKKRDRHTHTHAVTFYDFCNIFGGGLRRLLEEFKVVDFNGNAIRKTSMDYQDVDEYNITPEQLEYIGNDTHGLYHLIRIASATLKELTGYSIDKPKPDIMTAGGLAKKILLKHLYPDTDEERMRKKRFQQQHGLTVEQDEYLREKRLYQGGVCLLNENYAGRLLRKTMYRYDVNSEYPFIMYGMPDIYGYGFKMSFSQWEKSSKKYKKSHVCVYLINGFIAKIKPNHIPCFRHPYTGKYTESVTVSDEFLMFETEFHELEHWYEITASVDTVLVWEIRNVGGYRDFVDTYYRLKAEAGKCGQPAKKMFAKLLLNSSYGKLSERISREVCFREINPDTGAVHVVHTTETEIDENSRLSVVQGAYVTAMARVWILSNARIACKENTRKNLLYIDTDSLHIFAEMCDTDESALGAFKCEGAFNCVKYIAPKCYFDANIDENGYVTKNSKGKPDIEFHTKGISVRLVMDELSEQHISKIGKRFSYGQKFQPLCGMNIIGGKALIPLEKYLAKPNTIPHMLTTHGDLLIEE